MNCAAERDFLSWNEADRLAALHAYEILDSEPESAFDDMARIAAHICDAPIALVNFVEDRRQWTKAAVGTNICEIPLELSICAEAIRHPGLFVVPDLTRDPRFSGNPLVTSEPHLRFYAGADLRTREGLPLGTLCVVDVRARPEGLTQTQSEILLSLARGVMDQLHLRRANKALRDSEDHYRHTVELNPQIPWTADPEGNILEVSPRWHELTGMSEAEALGGGWVEALHPDDRLDATATWAASLGTGKPADMEYRLRLRGGAYGWMRTRAAPRRHADGAIARWYGTVEDIHDRKLVEVALRDSEEFARSILESSPDYIKVLDLDARLLFMNQCGLRLNGLTDFSGLEGRPWLDFWPAEHHAPLQAELDKARHGRSGRFVGCCPTASGEVKWWEVLISAIRDAEGSPVRLLAISRDVTDAKSARDAVDSAYARLTAVLESTSDSVIVLDRDWRVTYMNQRASEMVGGDAGLSIGMRLREAFPEQAGSVFDRNYGLAMERQAPVEFEAFQETLGLWLEVRVYPTPDALSIFFRDVSEARRSREEIAHLAHHDALTGLPNRLLFQQKLTTALSRADRSQVAVLTLDLDSFKEVNDTLGHPAGDALLREIADRLREAVPRDALLARLGGDEFAIIRTASETEDCAGKDAVADLAGRVIAALREPCAIDGRLIETNVSIGIAVAPRDGMTPDRLFKNSDIALYQAKSEGGGIFRFFKPHMHERIQARQAIKRDLAVALEKGELEVVYQPLADLDAGRVSSFEALLRWHHPTRGTIAPDDFIPMAEETGLMLPIGEWVLQQACRAAKDWPEEISIAVNLSPVQFRSRSLPLRIAHALGAAELRPGRLVLEITESVLLRDSEAHLALLHEMRSLGTRIALDDFGMGFSSLSYLRIFPFDTVKIDRSFVAEIMSCKRSAAIIRAVTGLARSLGMRTVAEGVETHPQLDWLKGEGCDQGQGYLFSRPIPAGQVKPFLEKFNGTDTLTVWSAAPSPEPVPCERTAP